MAFGETKIRNYEELRDRARVADLERRCEVGPAESVNLFMDTMGDAICRIRNSPMYKMLVPLFSHFFLSLGSLLLLYHLNFLSLTMHSLYHHPND